MRAMVVIQARMSSSRLPEKVLRPLAGKPMLGYLVEKMQRASEAAGVVVATSSDTSDDPVERFCSAVGVDYYRGPLDDVAARFLEVAERWDAPRLVRVSGDSPLLDQRLVDRALTLDPDGTFDLVTNVAPRTFPSGQSVEVVRTSALADAYGRMAPDHREHVTKLFYEENDARILNFEKDPPASHLSMTVDTEEDASRVEAILGAMSRPHWTYDVDEVIRLAEATASSGISGGNDGKQTRRPS